MVNPFNEEGKRKLKDFQNSRVDIARKNSKKKPFPGYVLIIEGRLPVLSGGTVNDREISRIDEIAGLCPSFADHLNPGQLSKLFGALSKRSVDVGLYPFHFSARQTPETVIGP